MRCFASVFPGKCICIRNRRNGCVAFLLRKQAQDIKRRYWERFEPDYLTDEQKLANIEAYLQIEKDFGIKRGRPMTETGRYHIAWRWKRKRSGHIITGERLPDGSLRFYDPQNGMSGALDLYKKDIAGNVRIYRVDNLAPNANIVKDVLTKGETKAAAGTAAQGGISGGITPANKTEWKELRKQAKREAKGYAPGIRYDKERFYTHNYTMSKNDRNCMLTHCYTDDEVKAVKQIPQLLLKLGKPRYEPLNTRRPNYRKKIERGAIHFVAYEIEINGKTFEFKTVVIKNNHKNVVEHPYSLKEKK